MKIARFFAVLFAFLGILLLVGSIALCLISLDAPIRLRNVPQGAVSCAETFAQAVDAGDLTAAGKMIYGQPDLGAEGVPEAPETLMVWNAFLESICFEYTGKYYATENGIARNASVVVLDISSVTQKLPERTQSLMNQRIAAAGVLEEIYDGAGQFRQDLVEQILHEALEQALAEDAKTVIREVTVKMVNRDGSWWIVPDQALLQAVSGLA